MTPEQMAEIHAACFTVPRPWSASEFHDLVGLPNVFSCTLNDGFAIGRVGGPEAELLTLAVAPQDRRKGNGSALLLNFEAQALERGATEAFLEVAVTNKTAIHLYRGSGFRQAGFRQDYYECEDGSRISCLVMAKQIASR